MYVCQRCAVSVHVWGTMAVETTELPTANCRRSTVAAGVCATDPSNYPMKLKMGGTSEKQNGLFLAGQWGSMGRGHGGHPRPLKH